MGINTLTINDIHSQQNLNKPKEKLRDHRHPFVNLAAELYRSEDVAYLLKRIEERTAYIRPASFSFGEWFVEKMLRGYEAVYKYITLTIHQINKFSSTSKPYVI